MKFKQVLAGIEPARIAGPGDIRIEDISYHSHRSRPGSLFVAIKGFQTDGHLFIKEALAHGAVGAIVEEWQDDPTLFRDKVQILVKSSRRALALASANLFSHPSEGLALIGVTGTNGKTTTAHLIESILATAGHRVGLLGTVSNRLGGEDMPQERTTPESYDLQKTLAAMLGKGASFVVAEVSSHAVDLDRVYGTVFKEGVFTNLSQDHLDYHGDIESYFKAKKRFFNGTVEQSILNVDDAFGRRIREEKPSALSYALRRAADVRAEEVKVTPHGSSFTVRGHGASFQAHVKLGGLFNVYNALAAASAGLAFDVPPSAISSGLAGVDRIPGRFERVDVGQPFSVIVDYAHTPDGLKEVISAARVLTKGRVITVFGCGGDRDRGKRPLMGGTAARLSDLTVLTSDNPRSEDPDEILRQIEEGAKRAGDVRYVKIPDRREAIGYAIAEAKPGDTVLIAGKGHEQTQIFADHTASFDDRKVAQDAVREAGFGR